MTYKNEIKDAVKAYARILAGDGEFKDKAFSAQSVRDGIYVTVDYRHGDEKANRSQKTMRDAMEKMGFHSSRCEHGTDRSEIFYTLPDTMDSVTTVRKATEEIVTKRAKALVDKAAALIDEHLPKAQGIQAKAGLLAHANATLSSGKGRGGK